MNRISLSTILWCVLLAGATIGVTVAAYMSLIIPEYRKTSFWIAMVAGCFGELVAFTYLPYLLVARHTTARPSPAVRMRVMVMIVLWVVFLLATGALAAAPSWQDTFFSDKILLWQLIASLALLMAAYFLSRQEVAMQARQAGPQQERVRFQSYASGLDPLLAAVLDLGRRHPEAAVDLDRLAKRLDTLKSHLLSISPAANRDADRLVDPVSTQDVERGLLGLHEGIKQLEPGPAEELPARAARAGQLVDEGIAAIRHRENALSF